MEKISDYIIKFITETIKNCKVELTAEGKLLGEMKIQRSIFQGDALSPLLLGIAMMPFSYIFKKCTATRNLQGKRDDIKLFAKNVNELNNLIQTIRIHSPGKGMKFITAKCVMLITVKGENRIPGRNRTAN